MRALVSNTDKSWFDFLLDLARKTGESRSASPHAGGAGQPPAAPRLDEVNFWRPRDQQALKSIQPGDPFFLRLKRPHYRIAGWGFFAQWRLLPFSLAWELFGEKNGAAEFGAFRRNVQRLRGDDPAAPGALPLGCVVLRDVTFLPEDRWLQWGATRDWARNIVTEKAYALGAGAGRELASLLQSNAAQSPPDLEGEFQLLDVDDRTWERRLVAQRDAQGTFRSRLLEAYGNRCALTGERVVPVLEAAHIQPYLGPASNHVQNGILLKADLHKLYDAGYVDITPDYKFRVSERVEEEFENGREYYALVGREVRRPGEEKYWPSRDALAWHGERMYR
ncbi:MAG TPA: HNH endonuclease [Planctomycetota bacterium]|nr:HNH endonuclease [Planctomycetota bacterium]